MSSVFYSILPIFLIAFLGNIIRKKWLVSDEFWRGLEKLSFYVLFPAMLFEHTLKVDFTNSEFTRLILSLVIAHFIIAIILVIYQLRKNYNAIQFTSIFQGATRYNSYAFFALGAALFGEDGLQIIATISPYLLILTNISSVICFVHYVPKNNQNLTKLQGGLLAIRSIVTNPFVIASIAGVLFNYFQLSLNIGIERTIHNLADASLTTGILIVGAGIKLKVKPEYVKQIMFTSLIKLMIMPLVTFIILWLMQVSEVSQSVGILFSCLPCATSSYILSRQLGGDPETMSSTITFTTILSIISLSILIYILA